MALCMDLSRAMVNGDWGLQRTKKVSDCMRAMAMYVDVPVM